MDARGSAYYITVLVFLFFPLFVSAQKEEAIPWSADRKLQWSDFKGSYFKTEWAAATTATGISYAFTTTEENGRQFLEIEVRCEFYPYRSWYRPEVCDANTLGHEQLHFDIAELYARLFRKRLGEASFTSDVKDEVKAIYKQILKELIAFQNKYDRETDFSKDVRQQRLWNRTIAEELLASEQTKTPSKNDS
ncbi:DUF922 domain-containing protein [Pricia sp. S334]|uniref:DUF922 domain-containing protein n=1 Tax=Pricia mediterranea TaxID=3076079 RepID=A0ABU3L1G1_9FLAO|nr:DUF922 domain-containing protein [Pricia sp. S334]MDT7827564.1 DUF922 domain-containing protein [Pricia sp. S334]